MARSFAVSFFKSIGESVPACPNSTPEAQLSPSEVNVMKDLMALSSGKPDSTVQLIYNKQIQVSAYRFGENWIFAGINNGSEQLVTISPKVAALKNYRGGYYKMGIVDAEASSMQTHNTWIEPILIQDSISMWMAKDGGCLFRIVPSYE